MRPRAFNVVRAGRARVRIKAGKPPKPPKPPVYRYCGICGRFALSCPHRGS